MIKVFIKTDSHYKVDRRTIRNLVSDYLRERGIKTDCELSINIVGNRKMRSLNKKYRDSDSTSSILSFSQFENTHALPFINSPDGILRLGDIVISYPQARDQAASEDKLVDDKINELVLHGLKSLLGNQQG